MQKLRLVLCVAVAAAVGLLLCPFWQGSNALLFAEGGRDQPSKEGGVVKPSEIQDKASKPAKDDPVAATSRDYALEVAARSAKLETMNDPAERERLQGEIRDLKAEEESAVKETMLLIAAERKDEEQIEELEDALERLYRPVKAQPVEDGVAQPADSRAVSTVARKKQPDDEPEGGRP
jgi:hypothetical protein